MKKLIGLVFIVTFAITAAAAWKTERKIDEMTDAVSYIIDTFGDPVGDAPFVYRPGLLIRIKRIRANGDPERITHEMKILFERAGIETTHTDKNGNDHTVASFHSLRHTFVSRLMERGVNPYYVQRAVGHSTMLMTAHYDHSAAEEIRKALDKKPRKV